MASPPRARWMRTALSVALLTVALPVQVAFALEPEAVFTKWGGEISAEGTIAHFGARLGEQSIQNWNLTGRFSLLPFGTLHFHLLGGALDGAPEVGLGPTFARFGPTSVDLCRGSGRV